MGQLNKIILLLFLHHYCFYYYLSTYCDCGQQPFRHISHNDADKKNDSLQPAVTQDDGQNEKGDAQEDSHTRDDMDEVFDLFGNRGFAGLQARRQGGNATHYRAVSSADHNTTGCAWFETKNKYVVKKKSFATLEPNLS